MSNTTEIIQDKKQKIYTIRPATNADGAPILQMMNVILTKYGLKQKQACDDPIDNDLQNIESCYFANHGYLEVLLDGQTIIGSAGIFCISAQTCELRKMYLKEEYRNLGLGKMLLVRMLNKAKEMGYKECELETATELVEARQMYENFGFTAYTPEHMCSRCNLAMKKVLV